MRIHERFLRLGIALGVTGRWIDIVRGDETQTETQFAAAVEGAKVLDQRQHGGRSGGFSTFSAVASVTRAFEDAIARSRPPFAECGYTQGI